MLEKLKNCTNFWSINVSLTDGIWRFFKAENIYLSYFSFEVRKSRTLSLLCLIASLWLVFELAKRSRRRKGRDVGVHATSRSIDSGFEESVFLMMLCSDLCLRFLMWEGSAQSWRCFSAMAVTSEPHLTKISRLTSRMSTRRSYSQLMLLRTMMRSRYLGPWMLAIRQRWSSPL